MTTRRVLLVLVIALLLVAFALASWADCHGHACDDTPGPCSDCLHACAFGCTHAVLASPAASHYAPFSRLFYPPAARLGSPCWVTSPIFEPPKFPL